MADAGKIVITPKGAYSSTKTYEWLDEVSYNGNAYVALKTVTGVTPSDDGVNWRLFMSSADVDANVLVPKFTEASTRSNIISGENLSTMFGKIKKWFTDLKSHAFKDLVNNLTTSTTGSALDASQGKVLQDEVDGLNRNLLEQKMLGWNVPAECPVQNIVSNEVFTQKVGRVDLGNLDWSYSSEYKRFSTSGITDYKKKDSSTNTWVADAFLKGYSTTNGNNTASDSYNKSIGFNGTSNMFFVKNTSYTDTTTFKNAMQGKYLYYELETEITMNVDGNEAVDRIKNDLTNTNNKLGTTNISSIGNGTITGAISTLNSNLGNKPNWTLGENYKFAWGVTVMKGANSFVPSINGKELTNSNCSAVFPVCSQPSANIIAYNGIVNGNGQWMIFLNVVPSGDCTFSYLAVVKSNF